MFPDWNMYLSFKLQNNYSSNFSRIAEMSIAISDVFVADFEQVFVSNEMSYLKVSQSLQMIEMHVTDNLFL